ncbi:MAG: hypothetical protein WA208_12675 [Thermoanaerobaculia bacterium]
MYAARRPELMPILLLLLGWAAAALAQREPRAVRAVLQHEEIIVHPDPRSLARICRSARDVRACTDFVAERFRCGCTERNGEWELSASFEFGIVIHAADTRYLPHERLHIMELQDALPKALERFTSLKMTDRAVCEKLATVMSAPSFARDVMNRLRKESNERLGCAGKVTQPRRRGTLIAAVHPPR